MKFDSKQLITNHNYVKYLEHTFISQLFIYYKLFKDILKLI